MEKTVFIADIALSVLALAAIIIDRNLKDKLLGALLLVFTVHGICSHYLGGTHTVTLILLYCCLPAALAFVIIAGRRLGELFRK